MNCRNVKFLSIAAIGIILTGCSSKKYDSWSECMSDEINKNNVGAAEAYCDANYDMTEREKAARAVWSCRGNVDQNSCVSNYLKIPEKKLEQVPPSFDPSAAPYDEGNEPEVGTRIGSYEFIGGDPNLQDNWLKHEK